MISRVRGTYHRLIGSGCEDMHKFLFSFSLSSFQTSPSLSSQPRKSLRLQSCHHAKHRRHSHPAERNARHDPGLALAQAPLHLRYSSLSLFLSQPTKPSSIQSANAAKPSNSTVSSVAFSTAAPLTSIHAAPRPSPSSRTSSSSAAGAKPSSISSSSATSSPPRISASFSTGTTSPPPPHATSTSPASYAHSRSSGPISLSASLTAPCSESPPSATTSSL